MFRKKYTNEEIINAAKESFSCAQLLSKLNLKPAGGNYATMKKKLAQLNVDCSHWTEQSWNKNMKLKNWENYTTTGAVKKHLIKHMGHMCESCNLKEWKSFPIPLEVHHIDGDRTNNDFENLSLLCPNCHSLTDNFRGKNIKTKQVDTVTVSRNIVVPKMVKPERIKEIKQPKIKIPYVRQTKINWPNKEELENMIKNQSLSSISKTLGVSDNAVRRRAKKYEIDVKSISKWSHRHGDSSRNWCLPNTESNNSPNNPKSRKPAENN